jgi:uncharacterized protein YukE
MAKKNAETSARVSTMNQEPKERKAPTAAAFGKIKGSDLPKSIAPGKSAEIIETAHAIAKASDKRMAAVKRAREMQDLIDEAEGEGTAKYQEALDKYAPNREKATREATRLNETIKAESSRLVQLILDPQGKLTFETDGSDDGAD